MERSELIDSIKTSLSERKIDLLGSHRIVSEDSESMLMHIPARPRSCWFKLIHSNNISEFYVTRSLNDLFISGMPEVIEYINDYHGLLMWEADGTTLRNNSSVEAWISAVETFAVMQLECCGLIRGGGSSPFKDWSIASLLESRNIFIENMILIMEKQEIPSPPAMTKHELQWLSQKLRDALLRVTDRFNLEALIHGDMNPGNIIVGQRCIFLDWVPAGIGYFSMALDSIQSYRIRECGYSAQNTKLIHNAYFSLLGIDPDSTFANESSFFASVIRRYVMALEEMTIISNSPERTMLRDRLLRSLTRWMYRFFMEKEQAI